MKILIIDDEKAARVLLKNKLIKIDNSLKIESVDNPSDGIIFIKENKPDVVFLDIQMPEMNGFEMLTNSMRDKENFPSFFAHSFILNMESRHLRKLRLISY